MQTSKIKNGIIIGLLLCAGILATCEFSKRSASAESAPLQDTLFLGQYRAEKKQKMELVAGYEKKIKVLQNQKDSLQNLVGESKKSTSAFRFKAKHFENQLKEALSQVITKDSLSPDTVTPLLDSLLLAHNESDTACDQTITILESIVSNRDSTILYHTIIETSLRELNKDLELKNNFLTEQLNSALKRERKITRHNKILSCGILIISGVAASLLITQSLK